MTAAVAAAQANNNAQIVAARAANDVLQTRNQARQALEYAERAYSDLQGQASLAQEDSGQKLNYESELADRFKTATTAKRS